MVMGTGKISVVGTGFDPRVYVTVKYVIQGQAYYLYANQVFKAMGALRDESESAWSAT